MSLSQNNWFRISNPAVMTNLGSVHHALFDFDGMISVLRQGWEPVMKSVMLEVICAGKTPSQELFAEVDNYIDISTGKLTILQMQWLADKVRSFGMEKNPLPAAVYKKRYLKELMVSASARLETLEKGAANNENYLIKGAQEFVRGLVEPQSVVDNRNAPISARFFVQSNHRAENQGGVGGKLTRVVIPPFFYSPTHKPYGNG